MSVNLEANSAAMDTTTAQMNVKMMQVAKNQQEVEGGIALQLVQAAAPVAPVGNTGHIISTSA